MVIKTGKFVFLLKKNTCLRFFYRILVLEYNNLKKNDSGICFKVGFKTWR